MYFSDEIRTLRNGKKKILIFFSYLYCHDPLYYFFPWSLSFCLNPLSALVSSEVELITMTIKTVSANFVVCLLYSMDWAAYFCASSRVRWLKSKPDNRIVFHVFLSQLNSSILKVWVGVWIRWPPSRLLRAGFSFLKSYNLLELYSLLCVIKQCPLSTVSHSFEFSYVIGIAQP